MSIERIRVPEEVSINLATDYETEGRTVVQVMGFGKRAIEIDGFMMLDEVESQNEHVGDILRSKIIGQEPAIDAIIEALDRTDIRLDNDHRPIANLAFLGPTGVGKSETAKTLASVLGDNNLVKIDCSEYSHGHETTALVGAPPSFVGYGREPILAEKTVESPGTVILFDEIEKGSPELYNLMLQIMGDGQLRLNTGDIVSFREAVIILTSNLGAKEMTMQLSGRSIGFGEQDRPTDKATVERVAHKSFTEYFKPEFTNRLNKMVVFHPLGTAELDQVLSVKLAEANAHYEDEFGVRLTLSNETREHLVSIAATESHLGARPLVRALEDNIHSLFGRYSASGMLPEGTHVRVIHRNEVPATHSQRSDSPFFFTARSDSTIRKVQRPNAVVPYEEPPTPEAPQELQE